MAAVLDTHAAVRTVDVDQQHRKGAAKGLFDEDRQEACFSRSRRPPRGSPGRPRAD